jgi:putative Mg2+ transporter-C (MgtC) family protein
MLLDQKIFIELLGQVSAYFGIGLQVITAFILGGLVGFDREQKMKAAGLKTNMLICIGATLYTTISMLVSQKTTGMVDPNRVAAQIVSGIGFLGAGAIIQGRGNVIGLTTAATIWVVAAIGYTVGAGYPFSAGLFTITVLVVLKLINPIYRLIEKKGEHQYFHLEILSRGSIKRNVSDIIFSEDVIIDELGETIFDENKDKRILNIYLTTHPRSIDRMVYELNQFIMIEKVSYHVVDNLTDTNLKDFKNDTKKGA